MLSEDQLTAMRALAATTFDQTATVQRPTRAPDGAGGLSETLATVATDVGCRIGQPATANERLIAEQLQLPVTHVLTFAHDADVRVGDVLVIGSRRFTVQQVLGPRAYPVHLRVVCLEHGA
jgi:SPP1 family predicted phage head-tail adaptor